MLKIDKFVADLNDLFKNNNNEITNMLQQNNINIRHRKVSSLIISSMYNNYLT